MSRITFGSRYRLKKETSEGSFWYKLEKDGKVYYCDSPLEKDVKASSVKIFAKKDWGKLKQFESNTVRFPSDKIAVVFDEKFKKSDTVESGYYELIDVNYVPTLVNMSVREEPYIATQNTTKEIVDDINSFLGNRKEIVAMGGLDKRGYFLYGQPGCGKTILIRETINNTIKEPFVAIWMNGDTFPGKNMMRLLNADSRLKIFVFEELTKVTSDPDSTQDLLQFLDGEGSPRNSLIFGTTNFPHMLEKNLADRPNRFDVTKEIKPPTHEEAVVFYETFLNRALSEDEKLTVKTSNKEAFSVAHIKEVSIRHRAYKKPLKQAFDEVMDAKRKADRFFEKEKSGIGIR